MFRPEDLFNLRECAFPELFDGCERAWDALKKLPGFVEAKVRPAMFGRVSGTPFIGDRVFVGKGTVIEHGAVIKGPAIIGENCQVRANAYVREHVIAGNGCVLGNASEFKNCVLFNGVQVPHFSYVGDSILGAKAHLGAGVILSNVKSLHGNVAVGGLDSGLRKFGAVLGDCVEVGCNCVLNPGTVVGRNSVIYPGVTWRGVCPPDHLVKLRQTHEVVMLRK